MMKKLVLALAAALTIQSSSAFAGKIDVAAEIVSCINMENGHVAPELKEPWHLTQAVLEVPYEHELTRLADGFYFIRGRRLGHHGTWAAFLDISELDWFAYEVRDQDDDLSIFAASFVPPEVVTALNECGVEWAGFWVDEYPIVVLDPPVGAPVGAPFLGEFRLPEISPNGGSGL